MDIAVSHVDFPLSNPNIRGHATCERTGADNFGPDGCMAENLEMTYEMMKTFLKRNMDTTPDGKTFEVYAINNVKRLQEGIDELLIHCRQEGAKEEKTQCFKKVKKRKL